METKIIVVNVCINVCKMLKDTLEFGLNSYMLFYSQFSVFFHLNVDNMIKFKQFIYFFGDINYTLECTVYVTSIEIMGSKHDFG